MEIKLSNCPFCGSKAEFKAVQGEFRPGVAVKCASLQCQASTKAAFTRKGKAGEVSAETGAAELWNKRTPAK